MKLEDMKVGAFVKCTKPEWSSHGDMFKITNKLSDNKWELTLTDEFCNEKKTKVAVSQKTLQHNFKLEKSYTVKRKITIVCYADGTTFIGDGTVCENVGLYHEDKYDEFVGAVEALAKLYGRKSPFEEIEELKDVARAADHLIEATEVSDEWSAVEKKYSYGDTVKLEGRENTAIKAEPFEVDAKELYAKPHSLYE